MRNDAIDVKVNKGLLAFWTEEECAAGGVVHEEVFGEDGGAGGVAEDVEVFFPVGIAVAGVVGADGFAFEGVAGGLVEAGGEGVGEGVGLWGESQISNDFPKIVDKIPDDRGWNRGKPGVNSVTLQRGFARV